MLVSVVRWCRVFIAGFRILSMVGLCIVGQRLFVVGEGGCGKILLFILTSGSGLSWSLLLLFCSVILLLLRGFWGSG